MSDTRVFTESTKKCPGGMISGSSSLFEDIMSKKDVQHDKKITAEQNEKLDAIRAANDSSKPVIQGNGKDPANTKDVGKGAAAVAKGVEAAGKAAGTEAGKAAGEKTTKLQNAENAKKDGKIGGKLVFTPPEWFTDLAAKDKLLSQSEIKAGIKETDNPKVAYLLKDAGANFDKIAGKDGLISFPELMEYQSGKKPVKDPTLYKPKC